MFGGEQKAAPARGLDAPGGCQRQIFRLLKPPQREAQLERLSLSRTERRQLSEWQAAIVSQKNFKLH